MDAPLTLLVVEDDPALREVLLLALSRRPNFRAIAARDGIEALALFGQHQPQALILDILLPHVNGLDVLRQLNEQNRLAGVAVIVISALGYSEVIQQAIAAGAMDFLVKPFDVEFLLRRLEQALKRATLPQPPSTRAGGA